MREAVTTAKLARELFGTARIKLEVIADDETLQPDVVGLVEAAAILDQGRLRGVPLLHRGSRRGDAPGRRRLPRDHAVGRADRQRARHRQPRLRSSSCASGCPTSTLVVDAGLGAPSHAAEALELGYDAVLLNTAVAKAADPVAMAHAFRLAVEAGRTGYEAGLMGPRDFASPSTPVVGTPFWHAVS